MSESGREFGFYTGFVDYRFFYPKPIIAWSIVGTVLLIITMISYCPQPLKLIRGKTSYGISPFWAISQATCLWLMSFNVLCLKYSDFVGIFQYSDFRVWARLLTFLNVFMQSTFYSSVPYLIVLFFDTRQFPGRNEKDVKRSWMTFVAVPIIAMTLYMSCLLVFVIIGLMTSFSSHIMGICGNVAGIAGFVVEMIQFLPQVYTTIKMKSGGSLSVLMLEIQAPVNIMNAIFMWQGNGESWTTWSASMADGGWEIVLLVLCLWYGRKKPQKEEESVPLQDLSSPTKVGPTKDVEAQVDENGNPVLPGDDSHSSNVHTSDEEFKDAQQHAPSVMFDEDGNPI